MPFRVNPPPLQSHFRAKSVCRLYCNTCSNAVCHRGMKAMLLADTKVELYSTDSPPKSVQLVYDDYVTKNCFCRIRNVACLGCGNIVGYHITQPCSKCMESCNNGHFWMFHTEGVYSEERQDASGVNTLIWASLAPVEHDLEMNPPVEPLEVLCR